MGSSDDDIGLLWQPRPEKSKARGVPAVTVMRAELPESTWRPPTELPRLRGAKRICIDVEGCDPSIGAGTGPGTRRGAFICGYAVARDDGLRAYLPTRHAGGDNLDREVVRRWALDELNGFDGEVVGAKLSYDLDMLAEEGITFPNAKAFKDVQVAEALLDENRFQYGLDAIARDRGLPGKDEELLRAAVQAMGYGGSETEVKNNIWRVAARYAGFYGERDCALPLDILAIQEPLLEAQNLTELWQVEYELTPVLVAMTRRGVRVDLQRVAEVRAALVKERDNWVARVKRLAGPQAELMQPDSFVSALEARGLKVQRTLKKKQPKVDKIFFERHAGDELVDAIASGRRVSTLITLTIDGAILGHHVNGRIHTTYNQTKGEDGGAGSGRLSSSDPNLQNVPKRENEVTDDHLDMLGDEDSIMKLVRGLFLPEEGEDWERHDLSQIEYRYLTHFAVGKGAEEAREMYRRDPTTDFHKMCARMAGLDPNYKPARTRVKNTNFCKVYGGGAAKIAQTAKIPFEEARAFVEKYDRDLPFVNETRNKAAKWADRRGFVTTILLRRARFHLWEPDVYGRSDDKPPLPHEEALRRYGPKIKRAWTYAALNWKLQGSAADHIKKALVQQHKEGVTHVLGPALLTVHDENDWSKPRTREGEEAAKHALRIMETCIELLVPVTAEAECGANWGEASS